MNFGKVSGKGIGVGLSQRIVEPLLHELSGHPGSLYLLLRDGGREDKSHSVLVPRSRMGVWTPGIHPVGLGGSHLILGTP